MSCGRIELDETKTNDSGHPPRQAWYAECLIHGFRGPGRDRRDDAVEDLVGHQALARPRQDALTAS